MADNETKPEPPIVFECGPKLTCPDGSEHDYSKWEQDGQCGTVVCSKCGHRAIDDAYWMTTPTGCDAMADLDTLRPEVSSTMRTMNGEAGGNRDDAYEVIEAELLRLSAVEQKWKQWINDGMRIVFSEQPK